MRKLLFILLFTVALFARGDELWTKTVTNVSSAPSWKPSTIVVRADMIGESGFAGYQESVYDIRNQSGAYVAVQVARSENGVNKPVDDTTPIPLERMLPREPIFESSAQGEVVAERISHGSENERIATYRFRYRGTTGTVTVDLQRALPLTVAYAAASESIALFSAVPSSVELKYVIESAGAWHPASITTRSVENADAGHPRRTLVISMTFSRRTGTSNRK